MSQFLHTVGSIARKLIWKQLLTAVMMKTTYVDKKQNGVEFYLWMYSHFEVQGKHVKGCKTFIWRKTNCSPHQSLGVKCSGPVLAPKALDIFTSVEVLVKLKEYCE